ncbi:hypothetical protein U1Q18_018562 [Sarracenia purpurea var. burkii]
MPLSMVPPTVQFHVPAVPTATVPAAYSSAASSSAVPIVPPNISAASSSAANVSSPHVNAPFDSHVDIPTSASLNSETIVAAQNPATTHVSAPTSVHPMMTRAKHETNWVVGYVAASCNICFVLTE